MNIAKCVFATDIDMLEIEGIRVTLADRVLQRRQQRVGDPALDGAFGVTDMG